jgi:hypothetical protein
MMINIILFHLFISFTTGQTSNKDLCLIVSINIVKDECLKSVYENVPWGIALFITNFCNLFTHYMVLILHHVITINPTPVLCEVN